MLQGFGHRGELCWQMEWQFKWDANQLGLVFSHYIECSTLTREQSLQYTDFCDTSHPSVKITPVGYKLGWRYKQWKSCFT